MTQFLKKIPTLRIILRINKNLSTLKDPKLFRRKKIFDATPKRGKKKENLSSKIF